MGGGGREWGRRRGDVNKESRGGANFESCVKPGKQYFDI